MQKEIKIVQYNPEWPKLFEEAAYIIKQALGHNFIVIDHIGSTAIPGLAAKPRIDVICQVDDTKRSIAQLEVIGYKYEGEWNIPFKYGFTKRDGIEINLHIYKTGHPEIELNIRFRDFLRQNQSARDEYQQLKYNLLENENSYLKKDNSLFTGYNLGKDVFIRKIIESTGFNKLRFLYCNHKIEWQEYHRIKVEEIFSGLPNIVYDYNHPHLKDKNHYHFVLCQGIQIIAIGHMEDLGNSKWGLRGLATDKRYQGNGYGKTMLDYLEQWCRVRGGIIIHLHSAPEAVKFYHKLGYVDMQWDDKSIDENSIDLAKKI